MNLNQIVLIGRVGKDPEQKATPSGVSVAKFSLATSNVFTAKDGTKKETTQWHTCVAFSRTAEIIGQYMRKGSEVCVVGRVEYRSWDKKDGTKGYMTEVMIERLQLGARPKGVESNADRLPPLGGKAAEQELPSINLEEDAEAEEIKPGDIEF